MDEVQVHVVHVKRLEGRGDALLHACVPWVVKLGGHPDLFSWDAGVLDALADLIFVAVSEGRIDVSIAGEQCGLDGFANLIGLGLPGSEAYSWDFGSLQAY